MSERRRGAPRDVTRISHQMEDVFQTMLISTRTVHLRSANGTSRCWRPAIDVYEADGVLHVVAELAGVSEDDIQVAIANDVLSIRGERSPVCGDPARSIYEMGLLYGPFAADIYLPFSIEKESVTAEYDNGLLHISLNRVQPTQVPINRSTRA